MTVLRTTTAYSRFATLAALASLLALSACDDRDDSRSELEARISTLEAEVDALREQLEDAAETGEMAQSTIAALRTELEDAAASLATSTSELEATRATVASLMSQLTALEARLDVVEAVLGSLAGTIELRVPFEYADASLVLGQAYPAVGGTVSFSQVRYWLSGVELVRPDGTAFEVPDAYYLVEVRGEEMLANGTAEDVTLSASRRETVRIRDVPVANYSGIRFRVGVDATHNADLSLDDGELHVLNNMAFDNGWMWFTSYVFTKSIGSFVPDGGSATTFRWDNGSDADYRTVELASFVAPIAVSASHGYAITAPADLAALVADVPPQANLTIGASTPTTRATLADAFAGMFSLASVAELSP